MDGISIIDLTKMVKGLGVDSIVLPFSFDAGDNESVITLADGFSPRTNELAEGILTIATRGIDIAATEKRALLFSKELQALRNNEINDSTRIVIAYPRQLTPHYRGSDESNRHYFESDFRIIFESY